jgi:hypothetical protein
VPFLLLFSDFKIFFSFFPLTAVYTITYFIWEAAKLAIFYRFLLKLCVWGRILDKIMRFGRKSAIFAGFDQNYGLGGFTDYDY